MRERSLETRAVYLADASSREARCKVATISLRNWFQLKSRPEENFRLAATQPTAEPTAVLVFFFLVSVDSQ